MKQFKHLLLLTFLISACGENKSKNVKSEAEKIDSTNNKNKLDSLDKVNNEGIIFSNENITKAYINLKDSSFSLTADMKKDHRFFGYKNPDTKSEKVILFSIFTNDVENNPFGCKLGAYYDTNGLENIILKYSETNGDFIKTVAIDNYKNRTTFFIEKKWVIIK